jgi:hypothetical protein
LNSCSYNISFAKQWLKITGKLNGFIGNLPMLAIQKQEEGKELG